MPAKKEDMKKITLNIGDILYDETTKSSGFVIDNSILTKIYCNGTTWNLGFDIFLDEEGLLFEQDHQLSQELFFTGFRLVCKNE